MTTHSHDSVADLHLWAEDRRSELLTSYRAYLLVLARFQVPERLRSRVDASDLVQDVLLQAHRDAEQFRGTTEEQLLGWLRKMLAYRISNVLRHYLATQRRNARREQSLESEMSRATAPVDDGLLADDTSPSERASWRERSRLVANAIERLSPDQREVIRLHHAQGLTMVEIAQRMNRSLDAVRKLWSRAVASLRREIGA